MKLRRLKFKNNKVLGDLELDFVNPLTDQPYNVVVFVGENGTGKTSILRSISDYINGISSFQFDYIEYEVEGRKYRKESVTEKGHNFVVKTDLTTRVEMAEEEDDLTNDSSEIRFYACAFSKARADFSTNKILSVSNTTLDTATHDSDESEDYTSLKQLIVDIENQDAYEFTQRNKEGRLDYPQFLPQSKMYRFTNAFNSFFGDIIFDRIKDVGKEKVIYFKKNGKEVPIDGLSTGEKQIVFRGAYLLKNSGRMEKGVVLIDEPELSMHPLWQQKILEYFCDLYKEPENGNIIVQLFFASHSEYVVTKALEHQNDTAVIVLNNNGGVISSKTVTVPFVLPGIIASEVNYIAFNIPTVDYHIALYGAIQRKYDKQSIISCDRFIETCAPYYVRERHESITMNQGTNQVYHTLPTKVRNSIDHPSTTDPYTMTEMKESIELMRNILSHVPEEL